MIKRNLCMVRLPHLKPIAELPAALAATLRLIIDAPIGGIATPELQRAGIVAVHNNIAELKRRGAVIHTDMGHFTDQHGKCLRRIAHYSYKGWVIEHELTILHEA